MVHAVTYNEECFDGAPIDFETDGMHVAFIACVFDCAVRVLGATSLRVENCMFLGNATLTVDDTLEMDRLDYAEMQECYLEKIKLQCKAVRELWMTDCWLLCTANPSPGWIWDWLPRHVDHLHVRFTRPPHAYERLGMFSSGTSNETSNDNDDHFDVFGKLRTDYVEQEVRALSSVAPMVDLRMPTMRCKGGTKFYLESLIAASDEDYNHTLAVRSIKFVVAGGRVMNAARGNELARKIACDSESGTRVLFVVNQDRNGNSATHMPDKNIVSVFW